MQLYLGQLCSPWTLPLNDRSEAFINLLNKLESSMATFFRALLLTMLLCGVISDDIAINDPVVIPVLVELVRQMDENSKGKKK